MKYILYAFLISVIGPRMARGQNISVQDTNRVLQLCDQAGYYQFFNSDTSLLLTFEAEALAQRLVFKMGEARAISRQAEVRHLRGEFPQALEAVLTAIQLSRKYKYPEVEAESLTFAGTIYFDLGDYNQSLTYLFQAKKIYDIIAHQLLGAAQQFPPFVLKNIGSVYEKLNRIDSALYYQKLALNYPIDIGPQLQADILVAIGEIERRQKDLGSSQNKL